MEANELPNIAERNKEYFNTESSKYDAHPTRVLCAKKCAEAILEEVKDLEGYEVMDFACGTGLVSQDLCTHVKSILGVDLSQNMVNEYNKKVWQQGIDKEEMQAICLELKESEGDQLNGRKFDLIVCASAYHHLDDINSTTRMLASYLKQGGELIVLDLKKDPEVSHMFHGGNKDHIISHEGGFYPEELEKVFLATGMLENVSSKVAFSFPKQIEKDKEHMFEWFLVRGKKI
ncbi:S-adenosyl-L-methionine-dependent methyltransferase [Gigaspora margarita]|uniref:S-adenosyl-L-methionine-dependent methyltransferase n=1 Tax=Gigaspora margarita TaxID=4874 RepID=A0A8H4B062_GIGMA|nr:S-adenosyl-L-methionine-dependent methyltransferase [Gigaspora margarita]